MKCVTISEFHCNIGTPCVPGRQLYVHHTGNVTGPYASCQAVQDTLAWRNSAQGQQALLQQAAVGGYHPYPPLPTNLQDYSNKFPEDTPMKVIWKGLEALKV